MFSFPAVARDGGLIDLAACIHAEVPESPFGDGEERKTSGSSSKEEDEKQLGTPEFPVLKCSAHVKMRAGQNSREKRLPASDRNTELPPDFCMAKEEKAKYDEIERAPPL